MTNRTPLQLVTPEVAEMRAEVNAAVNDMIHKRNALLEQGAKQWVDAGGDVQDLHILNVTQCECMALWNTRTQRGLWAWWHNDDATQTFTLMSQVGDRCIHMLEPIKILRPVIHDAADEDNSG